MKASELIAKLQEGIKQFGDHDTYIAATTADYPTLLQSVVFMGPGDSDGDFVVYNGVSKQFFEEGDTRGVI